MVSFFAALSLIGCRTDSSLSTQKLSSYVGPVGMQFVKLTPDTSEIYDGASEKIVLVRLSPYWIQTTEVTNKQYEAVCGPRKRPVASAGDAQPVTGLSFDEMQAFVRKVSELGKRKFRLPSRAELETAARGGFSKQLYPWGPSNVGVDEMARTSFLKSVSTSSDVMTFPPNPYGLYDTVGNASEVVLDSEASFSNIADNVIYQDPQFHTERTYKKFPSDRLVHGGSFRVGSPFVWEVGLAILEKDSMEGYDDVGLRLVMSDVTPKIYYVNE